MPVTSTRCCVWEDSVWPGTVFRCLRLFCWGCYNIIVRKHLHVSVSYQKKDNHLYRCSTYVQWHGFHLDKRLCVDSRSGLWVHDGNRQRLDRLDRLEATARRLLHHIRSSNHNTLRERTRPQLYPCWRDKSFVPPEMVRVALELEIRPEARMIVT